jgi:hypothetical protein
MSITATWFPGMNRGDYARTLAVVTTLYTSILLNSILVFTTWRYILALVVSGLSGLLVVALRGAREMIAHDEVTVASPASASASKPAEATKGTEVQASKRRWIPTLSDAQRRRQRIVGRAFFWPTLALFALPLLTAFTKLFAYHALATHPSGIATSSPLIVAVCTVAHAAYVWFAPKRMQE